MSNIYHVLYRKPALEREEMFVELEEIASALVLSGRFRIDADEKLNFVRFSHPYEHIEMIFSNRELNDTHLLPRTRQRIKHALSRKYNGEALEQKTDAEIQRLRSLLGRYIPVSEEMEMKLARALVQACEPIVMLLILAEGVEVFISFSHTVGDMLDMRSWQMVGSSGGLQSTQGQQSAVFVSCGGNPLYAGENASELYGDGFPALARLIVIAGQELGHFADILRDDQGRKVSRHSADLGGTRAKEKSRIGRLKDIEQSSRIFQKLHQLGLGQLAEVERHIDFYGKHNTNNAAMRRAKRKRDRLKKKFIRRCLKAGLGFILTLPKNDNVGSQITMMMEDMLFNLSPQADAYSRENPVEEEAIACIEALARVPQQVNKWGYRATRILMPNLYKLYYREVIPACAKSYYQITGLKYKKKLTRYDIPWWQKWWRKFLLKRHKQKST